MLTDYEFEARRGDYEQRDRDYELEHAERYRRMSVCHLALPVDWKISNVTLVFNLRLLVSEYAVLLWSVGCENTTLLCVYVGEVDDYQQDRLSRRGEWDVDERRHSGATRGEQVSSAGRGAYSDRLRLDVFLFFVCVLVCDFRIK